MNAEIEAALKNRAEKAEARVAELEAENNDLLDWAIDAGRALEQGGYRPEYVRKLEAKNALLVKALQQIVEERFDYIPPPAKMREIARKALAAVKEEK